MPDVEPEIWQRELEWRKSLRRRGWIRAVIYLLIGIGGAGFGLHFFGIHGACVSLMALIYFNVVSSGRERC